MALPRLRGIAPYAAFKSHKHFGNLDGLRGLAILAVIWHHGPGTGAAHPLLHSGYYGVHLFFGISGFLITTLLLREPSAAPWVSLRNFYARRALRIFPLYYTTVAVYLAFVIVFRARQPAGREFFANLPYFLTYTSNWFVRSEGTGPGPMFVLAWSLATEEQFYSTWPWCERYLPGHCAALLMTLLVACTGAVTAGWLDELLQNAGLLGQVIRSVSLPICLGVLFAHALDDETSYAAVYRILGQRASCSVIVTLITGSVWLAAPPAIVEVLLVCLVAACVIREDHSLAPLLTMPVLRRVGVISYGMYLSHALIYNLLAVLGSRFALIPGREAVAGFVIVVLVTFVLATVSFEHYESRFLRLKRRFSMDPATSPASVPASV